jgi:glyoxylase-like metal-dependent hydrolase (beta-lactamase superfamily II)
LLAERDLRLRWVLRTHQHDDRAPQERAALARLGASLVQGQSGPLVQVAAQGEWLTFGNEVVSVIATPGHTAHCRSYVWRDRVFCGGLLGVDVCPHQPYPARPEALWDSVRHSLFTLPDETLLFVGHAHRAQAVTTVLQERRWNPWFAALSRDEFLTRVAPLRDPVANPETDLVTP